MVRLDDRLVPVGTVGKTPSLGAESFGTAWGAVFLFFPRPTWGVPGLCSSEFFFPHIGCRSACSIISTAGTAPFPTALFWGDGDILKNSGAFHIASPCRTILCLFNQTSRSPLSFSLSFSLSPRRPLAEGRHGAQPTSSRAGGGHHRPLESPKTDMW